MKNIIDFLNLHFIFKIVLVVIILDTILGSARALKEHKWNSTFGIDGIIRKTMMVICVIAFIILDYILGIDLLFFIPEEISNFIHISRAGISELFGILFILYEATSILKNMYLCGLPVPKQIKEKIETLLKNMTTELDKKEG